MSEVIVDIFRDAPPSKLTRLVEVNHELRLKASMYKYALDNLPGSLVLLFDHTKKVLSAAGSLLKTKYLPLNKTLDQIAASLLNERLILFIDKAFRYGESSRCIEDWDERRYLIDVGPVIAEGQIIAAVLLSSDITNLL